MPKTRVQVPLDEKTLAAVKNYGHALGIPTGRACAQILAECSDAVDELGNALRMAKTAPAKAIRDFSHLFETKLAEADQMQLDMKPKPRAKRKKAG
jgi:hypothetical protein